MQTKGAIGYVETAYAKQNKLTTTKMINKDGKTVDGDAGSDHGGRGRCRLGQGSGLLHDPHRRARRQVLADRRCDLHPRCRSSRRTPPPTKEALKFFAWAYKNGDEMASSLDYIPMPDSVVALIQAKWKSEIKDDAGKPVF